MKIALLHYSAPPVIGGVETVVAAQARLLRELGHEVALLAGAGAGPGTWILPELGTAHPAVRAVREELLGSGPGPLFDDLRDSLERRLLELLAGWGVVVAHNLMTMPFHPAATAALAALPHRLPATKFVAWVHDLAVANPDLPLARRPEHPWNLLARPADGYRYVAVSEHRASQVRDRFGVDCPVVPNGIDPAEVFGLPDSLARRLARFDAWTARPLLILPARLVPRKNIELAIRVVAQMRRSGSPAKLLLTAPPDPHNPDSVSYRGVLRHLGEELGVGDSVCFLGDDTPVDSAGLAALYRAADALIFPSRQEGFGLPPLEAAMHRLPVFCAGLPALLEGAGNAAHYFAPEIWPEDLARLILQTLESEPAYAAKHRVLKERSWTAVAPRLEEFLARRRLRPCEM